MNKSDASFGSDRRMNRGSLPAHLPRVEMVIDVEDNTCPCCRNALHRIGEDCSEKASPHRARGSPNSPPLANLMTFAIGITVAAIPGVQKPNRWAALSRYTRAASSYPQPYIRAGPQSGNEPSARAHPGAP